MNEVRIDGGIDSPCPGRQLFRRRRGLSCGRQYGSEAAVLPIEYWVVTPKILSSFLHLLTVTGYAAAGPVKVAQLHRVLHNGMP